MTGIHVLQIVRQSGGSFWVEDNDLKISAPPAVLSTEHKLILARDKAGLLELFSHSGQWQKAQKGSEPVGRGPGQKGFEPGDAFEGKVTAAEVKKAVAELDSIVHADTRPVPVVLLDFSGLCPHCCRPMAGGKCPTASQKAPCRDMIPGGVWLPLGQTGVVGVPKFKDRRFRGQFAKNKDLKTLAAWREREERTRTGGAVDG
jgi:hypothetical protein